MKRKRVYLIGPFGKTGNEIFVCRSLNECRKMIYLHGEKGTTYRVDGAERISGEIWETYEMILSEAGIVFTRKTFDKWKNMKLEAELRQQNLKFEK